MKIKIARKDPRFNTPEEFMEEAGRYFGVEIEEGPTIPLTLSIDAYRSGICGKEDEEKILGCLKNYTYCPALVLETKEELNCDGLLVFTPELPKPPERTEGGKVEPGFANIEEKVSLVWEWAGTNEVLHELGHLAGLDDCPNRGCLMNKKERGEELCDECSEKLS